MRKLACVIIIAGLVLFSFVAADACGDKALRIGRGVRFRRAVQPAAVLIYIPANAARANQLQSILEKVGHKPYAAEGIDRLNDALRSGRYDLVFVDLVEAAALSKRIESSASKPVLIPVVSGAAKADVTAAKKQYRIIVTNPHDADRYFDAIGEAMRSRVHLLAKKA